MVENKRREDHEVVVTEEALKEAEKYIEEEERPSRRVTEKMDLFITAVAVLMSLVHLYAAVGVENFLWKKATVYERIPLLLAGLMLVYPKPLYDFIGFVLIPFVLVSQKLRKSYAAYSL